MPSYLVVFAYQCKGSLTWAELSSEDQRKLPSVAPAAADTADAKADRPRKEKTMEKKIKRKK